MTRLTVGYMQNGATVALNSWIGDSEFATLDEARQRLEALSQDRRVLAVGVWPSHHWGLGHPTCKPLLLVDKTPAEKRRISSALAGLVNAQPPNHF